MVKTQPQPDAENPPRPAQTGELCQATARKVPGASPAGTSASIIKSTTHACKCYPQIAGQRVAKQADMGAAPTLTQKTAAPPKDRRTYQATDHKVSRFGPYRNESRDRRANAGKTVCEMKKTLTAPSSEYKVRTARNAPGQRMPHVDAPRARWKMHTAHLPNKRSARNRATDTSRGRAVCEMENADRKYKPNKRSSPNVSRGLRGTLYKR